MSAVPVARSIFLMTLNLMAGNVRLKIDTVSDEGASVQTKACHLPKNAFLLRTGRYADPDGRHSGGCLST